MLQYKIQKSMFENKCLGQKVKKMWMDGKVLILANNIEKEGDQPQKQSQPLEISWTFTKLEGVEQGNRK